MDPTLAETLTRWRRHLHANPSLTLYEGPTAAFVVEKLKELGVTDIATDVGGHGVVATLHRPGSNRSVGLRADMDALPIEEAAQDLAWRSTNPGVMHACGHDGHTTALLGAAALLLQDESWSGTVRLVFQPAEEGGGGAASMVKDGLFQRFPMDRIFGWHNWPGLAAGTIAVHDSAVMAAGRRFEIVIEGHAGHAALPHLTRDPMVAAGHAIVACQSIVARNIDPMETGVVSLTMIRGGEAENQIAARVTIKGSMRFIKPEIGREIEDGLRRVAEGVSATFGVQATSRVWGGVPVTANHPEARELAAGAAAAVTSLRRDLGPAMTGEDFSHFLHQVPGAFVWIGNGPAEGGCELHNPHYDFNDAVLPVASGFLAEAARRSLAQEPG
ncbi:amidohydrolase [Pseudoroseomonas rhizosphaerae]|uniref:Amidohydrolase n=1 Tax=Teichococcus rhizosphaerae TaxID=1335062 RepID=A0A2C6ZD19_9PROT|nr:amidohydrolase [Pseudoroseomonas rhizosphaerae]PHK96381.1 amidohydrolase [Pseudoroseomonas rhizosphaerae]